MKFKLYKELTRIDSVCTFKRTHYCLMHRIALNKQLNLFLHFFNTLWQLRRSFKGSREHSLLCMTQLVILLKRQHLDSVEIPQPQASYRNPTQYWLVEKLARTSKNARLNYRYVINIVHFTFFNVSCEIQAIVYFDIFYVQLLNRHTAT